MSVCVCVSVRHWYLSVCLCFISSFCSDGNAAEPLALSQSHTCMQRPLLNSPLLNSRCGGNSHRNIFNERARRRGESTSMLLWWLFAVRSNSVRYLLISTLCAERRKGFNDFLSNGESECNARGAAVSYPDVGDHLAVSAEDIKYLTGIWPFMYIQNDQRHQSVGVLTVPQ